MPLKTELNKSDKTVSTVFSTFKQGIKDAYNDFWVNKNINEFKLYWQLLLRNRCLIIKTKTLKYS